jgi:signal peptidase II
MAAHPRRLAVTVAAAIVALDALTKALAVHFLSGRGRVDVLGGRFHLELYRNFDGPGNSLAGHTVLISIFTVAAVIAMTVAVRWVRTPLAAVVLGLLLGGGIGNMLDRLLRAPGPLQGGVVDWIKPTASGGSMNVADLALNAALAVVVVAAALTWWRERRAGAPVPD